MLKLIHHGGFGMFPILVFGGIGLLTAAWFAWRAEQRVRGFLGLMGPVVIFATLAAFAQGIISTLFAAAHAPPPIKSVLIMRGVGEAMSPLVLGFVILTLPYLLTAIGQRRLDGRRSAET